MSTMYFHQSSGSLYHKEFLFDAIGVIWFCEETVYIDLDDIFTMHVIHCTYIIILCSSHVFYVSYESYMYSHPEVIYGGFLLYGGFLQ